MVIYENDEIYVRPLRSNDVEKESYEQWFFDQEVCKYNSHGIASHGNNYQHFNIDEDNITWAVLLKATTNFNRISDNNLHIGNVVLQIDWINRNAEFTCIFGEKEYWKKGYCTQALQWIISHGFNRVNLHKIWLGTVFGNEGMEKSALNAGMDQEAELWDHVFIQGKFRNVIRYAIRANNG